MHKSTLTVSTPDLRQTAEEKLAHKAQRRPEKFAAPEDLQHELQVHQIELEMQNETLRQIQIELEESRDRYLDLFEFAPIGYLTLSREGLIVSINLTGAALLGEDRKLLLNNRFTRFIAALEQDHWQQFFMRAWRHGKRSEELLLRRTDGATFEARLDVLPASTDATPLLRVALTDVSEHKQLEAAREEALSKTRIERIASRVPGVIYEFRLRPDGSSCFPYSSEAIRDIYRVSPEEVKEDAAKVFAVLHPEDIDAVIASIKQSAHELKPWQQEYRVKFNDGTQRWLYGNGVPQREADDSVIWHGFITDITERKLAEERLSLAASVFTHASEGIMICAADGSIIEVNNAFSQITGFNREEVIGQNPRFLNSGLQSGDYFTAMWHDLLQRGQWAGEVWNRRKNGEVYVVMQTVSAVHDTSGNVRQYVALFLDITALKDHERHLEYIAHYDALTSLPNRILLADRLNQAMALERRRRQLLAVAYLDLDGFKAINDTHGHATGDQLLMALSIRMQASLREGDTLSRLGGDEFVAVLIDLTDVADSAPLLGRLLAAVSEPVQIDQLLLQVSASIGVTFFPQADEVDADQLMRQSDQAMYQAKLAGKNRYHVFDAEQDRSVRGHHESLERIRRALHQGEFVLYYQPQVNMRTGSIVGAEALIRWLHPEKGLLPPAMFLPVIENHALAVELGEWVIDTALTQLEHWQAAGLDIPVSVNIGARQLQQVDFVDRLQALMAAHPQLSPSCLELEVLETSALEDLAHVSAVINACRGFGVKFALDDFGTGYSSLTYLKRLSVSQLKIDQSFVHDMLEDPEDLAILEGVLGLARAFRRQAVAEGVETVAHGEMLLQLGCELGQGYSIARPMPADEFPAWSKHWRPAPSWLNLAASNSDDLPMLYAIVEHRAWIVALETCLKSEHLAPPPLDHQECRFGQWLHSEGLAGHAAQPAFLAIEALHRQVHALGEQLCRLHAEGRNAEALARLDELHDLRDALLERMQIRVREGGGRRRRARGQFG